MKHTLPMLALTSRLAAPKTVPIWLPLAAILGLLAWLTLTCVCLLLWGPEAQP